MNALDTIKKIATFQGGTLGVKGVTVNGRSDGYYGDVFGPLGQRNADWSGTMGPELNRAYRLCATAYACSTFLADAVAESPLRVYRIEQGDLIEQPDHRLRKLLASPCPVLSEAELMGMLVMTMGMFGYGIIEKVRSGAGIVVELWPLRPDWLKWEKPNWVYRKPGHEPRTIDYDDLIFIPYRHDEQQERVGVSPLHIVAREIGIDVGLTDLLKVFLDAGGIPPWAIEMAPDSMTPTQAEADAFRELWRQKYGGWGAYQNIGILYAGMKLVKVGDSIGDMAWPDLRGMVEMKIAQAFRVPAELIQARDSMNSGSLTVTEIDGAMAALQSFGAAPLRTRIDGAFTRGLLPEFADGTYTVEFDTSDILSLQEDRNALHDRVRADFDAGAITLNQFLQETGRPELGTPGDVYKTQFTTMYVPARELASSDTTTPPKTTIREIQAKRDRVYVDRKAFTDAEHKAREGVLATTQRNRVKLTEIGTRKLRKFFVDQGQRMIGALPKADGDLIDAKATLVDWDEEDELLQELMRQFYNETGKSAFGQVAVVTGLDAEWNVANPHIRDLMSELALRVTGISETTRADVQKIIVDGLAEGMGYQELGKELSGLFEESYRGRAETIARSESAHAYSKASVIGYEESGSVDSVELVDNPDHDTDPMGPTDTTCAQRDRLKVSLEEVNDYVDSMHPNCVMAVLPILNRTLGE